MNSKESISSLISQSFQLLVVIRKIICESPWKQDQLTVTVNTIVKDPITFPLENVVAHMDSFNL